MDALLAKEVEKQNMEQEKNYGKRWHNRMLKEQGLVETPVKRVVKVRVSLLSSDMRKKNEVEVIVALTTGGGISW